MQMTQLQINKQAVYLKNQVLGTTTNKFRLGHVDYTHKWYR